MRRRCRPARTASRLRPSPTVDAAPRITRLILQDFRTYRGARPRRVARRSSRSSARTGPARPTSSRPSPCSRRGAACAGRSSPRWRGRAGPGSFAVSIALDTAYRRAPARHRPRRAGRRRPRGPARAGSTAPPAASPAAFAEHLRVVWLTPDLDALFRGPAGDRRRFLDRLVLAVDAEHGARVERPRAGAALAQPGARGAPRRRALARRHRARGGGARRRGRGRPPRDRGAPRRPDPRDPRRRLAVPLRDARRSRARSTRSSRRCRPSTRRTATGRSCATSRARDRAAGRTLVGPQASDLLVRHGPKDIPAAPASTGEQKALLIGLVLAHARLVAHDERHRAPRPPRRGRRPSRPAPPGRPVRGASRRSAARSG